MTILTISPQYNNMRTSNRTTNSAPLLMSFSTLKKYNAEENCFHVAYDDEKQIVYYMGGGGSSPSHTNSKKYGSRYGTSGDNMRRDDPYYGQDD